MRNLFDGCDDSTTIMPGDRKWRSEELDRGESLASNSLRNIFAVISKYQYRVMVAYGVSVVLGWEKVFDLLVMVKLCSFNSVR